MQLFDDEAVCAGTGTADVLAQRQSGDHRVGGQRLQSICQRLRGGIVQLFRHGLLLQKQLRLGVVGQNQVCRAAQAADALDQRRGNGGIGLADFKETAKKYVEGDPEVPHYMVGGKLQALANNHEDYKRFYHNVNGEQVRHDKVHNLFGYNMTRSAGEAFERISPDKRILMFSRSSYIGMHRYGGIWTGDNCSWWSHILLNLKMMPSLNMCGFLYTGADLGGFGANTTRDLLLRWLALGVFTPLMRNHAALGTREQEPYQFEHIEDFRNVIGVRYRLVPYLYSEYMKAALNDDMYFKPLAFVYPDDKLARNTEDQLMIGNEIMIAPVYTQNAIGRYVYLPEEMMFVKFLGNGNMFQEVLPKGIHYVEVALNEVPLFIRKGCAIPVADFAESVPDIKEESIRMVGYEGASYERYTDDGVSRI